MLAADSPVRADLVVASSRRLLGADLRKAHQAAGLTQEKLAFAGGLDRTYIGMLENDKKSPTVGSLLRICAALGVSAWEIVAKIEKAAFLRKRRLS